MRRVMRSRRTAAGVGASRPSSFPFLPQHSLRLRIGLNWSNLFLTRERAGKIRRNASREVCFVSAYSPSYQEVSYLHLSFILASNRKTKQLVGLNISFSYLLDLLSHCSRYWRNKLLTISSKLNVCGFVSVQFGQTFWKLQIWYECWWNLPSSRTSTSHNFKMPLPTILVMLTNLPFRGEGQRILFQCNCLNLKDPPHGEFFFRLGLSWFPTLIWSK